MRGGESHPSTIGSARELAATVLHSEDALVRAQAFTRSFLMRPIDGPLTWGRPPAGPLPPDVMRMALAIENERAEGHSGGYLIVDGPIPDRGGRPVWAVCVHLGRLASAFEFVDRDRAVASIPAELRVRSNVAIVEAFVWASTESDVSELLSTLAEDVMYTDLESGGYVEGAVDAVDAILLASSDLVDHGYDGIEFRAVDDEMVEVTGLAGSSREEGDGSKACWRWTVRSRIVDGRIVSATRYRNVRVDPDELP